MSLYRCMINTLKKEKAAIILYTINTCAIILYYYFTSGMNFDIYPVMLTGSLLICYLLYKFFVYRNLYVYIDESRQSPEYKIKHGYVFEDFFDAIKDIHKHYISEICSMKSKYEERDKILQEWIHNMKTSVSIIELAAEKGKRQNMGEIIEDIACENVKLKEGLNGTLNLFRLDDFSRDYVPERINLKELVESVINSEKRNFIYSGVFPKVKMDDEYIYTDKKWSSYCLRQIITNSIKYSKRGKTVYFYCDKKEKYTVLHIKDEGIGIKKEEQARVFDAFFTGSNGRKNITSSGIGLYMCKTICEMLSSKISIDSIEGVGTTVNISYLTAE